MDPSTPRSGRATPRPRWKPCSSSAGYCTLRRPRCRGDLRASAGASRSRCTIFRRLTDRFFVAAVGLVPMSLRTEQRVRRTEARVRACLRRRSHRDSPCAEGVSRVQERSSLGSSRTLRQRSRSRRDSLHPRLGCCGISRDSSDRAATGLRSRGGRWNRCLS